MLKQLSLRLAANPSIRRWRADRADRKLARSLDPNAFGLHWQPGPRCPQNAVEGNRALIGPLLFVTGGYVNDCATLSRHLYRLDMRTDIWTDLGEIPQTMPETHNAVVSDRERYFFSISGQKGAHCSPAVPDCFVYDTKAGSWDQLPPLPEPRYMPMADYHAGRIYILGGSLPDRCSPAFDCWSLGVREGRADDEGWRRERPLPESRTHTPCLIQNGKALIFGGQTGDVPPVPGSAEYFCDFESPNDTFFDTVFSFDLATGSRINLAPMPLKVSHTEYTLLHIGRHVVIAGGTLQRTVTSDGIMSYDLERDSWKIIGRLPYPMKKTVTAYHDGWLYVATGQRAMGLNDPRPGEVIDSTWKTPIPPGLL